MTSTLETQAPATHDFQTKYGRFGPGGRSYIITRPDTPKPWANVLANPRYGAIISQAGGGFSWIDHSALSVLTRWRQDLVRDDWGKWLYIKDAESGALWSAAPQPTRAKLDHYLCEHGLGFTRFEASCNGIDSEWTITVPPDASFELWFLKLRNPGKERRRLLASSFLFWNLGASPDNHREFHRLFFDNRHDPASNAIIAAKHLWEVPTEKHGHWNTDFPHQGFHTIWRPGGRIGRAHACGDHAQFTGRHGDWGAPAWLAGDEQPTGGFGRHADACAALAAPIDLAPGEEAEVAFAIGVIEQGGPGMDEMLAPYRGADARTKALASVEALWSSKLGQCAVETPDPAFDLLNNTWLPYQAVAARLWGRTGYWQQSGAFGFRDQLQDSQVFLPTEPESCAAQIRLHARHQFLDGSVYHWWHPLSEVGHRTMMTDDLLWLPYVLASYLKETDDFGILDDAAPFVDSPEETSLWDHSRRAIELVLSRYSPRGLPLIGEGDWNDGLSAAGRLMKGESVWLGHFLHGVLRDWTVVAERIGRAEDAARWTGRADALREALNTTGWDGDWYWRATLDDGTVLGSAKADQGRIFLNAQTWAVLHQVADPYRARSIMDAVDKHLLKGSGPLLFTPAYDKPDPRVGYLTRYAPGTRENGGVYTHAAVWGIWAACRIGDADLAWRMFERLAPPNRGMDADGYAVEPYVTPGNINGPESPNYGSGGWTWYTGSAAWLRRVCHMGILGIEPEWGGLAVRPCLPNHWKSARFVRPYRGDTLRFEYANEAGGGPSKAIVAVDGVALEDGCLLRASGEGRERLVTVRIVPAKD